MSIEHRPIRTYTWPLSADGGVIEIKIPHRLTHDEHERILQYLTIFKAGLCKPEVEIEIVSTPKPTRKERTPTPEGKERNELPDQSAAKGE